MPSFPPIFERLYFCFDGCKKGFIKGCRPFIGVDGCHLKIKYDGQLLVVVARDPKDKYYPLEFGIMDIEIKDNWKWILELLLQDIGAERKYVFISD